MRADVVVREVATGLRRNLTMTVAMLLTTAISLGLVGTGLLAVRVIDRTEELYSARVEVQVALTSDLSARDTDCSQPACAALHQRLAAVPGVEAVRFVNQQQAYERYKELFAGQALADLAEPGTLPASLRVKLREDLQGPAGAAAVRAAVDGQVGVRTVVDQRETVGTLFDFLAGVRNVTFALALTQAVAAVLLISNAVQVSAFTRRTEVGVMRLVGATRWFTQLPFLVEAVVTGVAGALLASVALVVAKFLLVDDLLAGNVGTSVVPPVQLADVLWVAPILVLLGAGVAALTGYVTLRLYVRL
ncbi:permease-like cell division protein FtsX [Pseudonocardia sp.]|uniref:permease-like cell division protein FtsX n=1 Tax=Pseudonocardia sp. TaxID=60912 RepID=UPI003D0E2788